MKGTISISVSNEGSAQIFRATPDDNNKHPGLIVIEEVWGVDAHMKDVTERFANEGYVAISPELLPEGLLEKLTPQMKLDLFDPEKRNEAQPKLREAMQPMMQPEFGKGALAKLQACVDYLESDALCDGNIGVVGFCFGGTYSFQLAANDARIKAAVPFYGQMPDEAAIQKITCPILNFNGAKDERIMEQLPTAEALMKKYGKEYRSVVYPDAGHAFFNDTNKFAYNADAAKDAWEQTLAFLRAHLA